MSVSNFYDYEGVSNDFKPVSEEHIGQLMFAIFKDFTDSDRYTETKRLAKAAVDNVADSYEDLLTLSNKCSHMYSDYQKKKDAINFAIGNGRFMDKEDLKNYAEVIAEQEELIAMKMIVIMDSLNKEFEKYNIPCRFTNMSNIYDVLDQATILEEETLNKSIKKDNFVTYAKLLQNKKEELSDDRTIATAGINLANEIEGKFSRFADNRHYNDSKSLEKINQELIDESKKANIQIDYPDARLVYSDDKGIGLGGR